MSDGPETTGNAAAASDAVPLVVIDAANVVGSVPDGWWRDRHGATERLRDRLADLSRSGLGAFGPPVEVVLVVEGAAAGVTSSATVSTVPAPHSGDDRIVELVRRHPSRRRLVVTSDRELRSRVTALGAEVAGPSVLPDRGRHT